MFCKGESEGKMGRVLFKENWRSELGSVCQRLLKERQQIVLCITGRTGSGKSTLGKSLRKSGLLPFVPARQIAVIDDSVLSVSILGFFQFRVRRPTREHDELAPFKPFLRNKRLLVYVNSNPGARISRCDVVLHLLCDEEVRKERLRLRNHDGEARYAKSLVKGDPPALSADFCFEMRLD